MTSASGKLWATLISTDENKKGIIEASELPELARWAFAMYFSDKNMGKRWFRADVTEENVLNEFLRPESPISPKNLVNLWRDIPSIQKGLGSLENKELDDAVSAYLDQKDGEPVMSSYTKGDATLHEMSDELGNITPTMVNKIFLSGAEKIRTMTGGVTPEDMSDQSIAALMSKIDSSRQEASLEFVQTLKSHGGNISAFLETQVRLHNMTRTEVEMVSKEEIEGLFILYGLPEDVVIQILLADIEEDDNVFKTFQNAASKKIFPSRSGRPVGSKNKEAYRRRPRVIDAENLPTEAEVRAKAEGGEDEGEPECLGQFEEPVPQEIADGIFQAAEEHLAESGLNQPN